MIDGEIRVECQPTNPPKPTGFGVLVNGKLVATLTLEQMQNALAEYYRANEKRRID